jgi:hypothetical protein
MLSPPATGTRFRPSAVRHSPNRTRRWRAVGLLMAICAAAALAYAYMNEAQANQQLRDMLKVYDTQHAVCMRLVTWPISRGLACSTRSPSPPEPCLLVVGCADCCSTCRLSARHPAQQQQQQPLGTAVWQQAVEPAASQAANSAAASRRCWAACCRKEVPDPVLHCQDMPSSAGRPAGRPAVDFSAGCPARCQSICGAAARPTGACLPCRTRVRGARAPVPDHPGRPGPLDDPRHHAGGL